MSICSNVAFGAHIDTPRLNCEKWPYQKYMRSRVTRAYKHTHTHTRGKNDASDENWTRDKKWYGNVSRNTRCTSEKLQTSTSNGILNFDCSIKYVNIFYVHSRAHQSINETIYAVRRRRRRCVTHYFRFESSHSILLSSCDVCVSRCRAVTQEVTAYHGDGGCRWGHAIGYRQYESFWSPPWFEKKRFEYALSMCVCRLSTIVVSLRSICILSGSGWYRSCDR